MDYRLESLGSDRFQLLAQALLVTEFPGAQLFPVGQPDGGRDAATSEDEVRTGLVFQVKFSKEPSKIENVAEWTAKIGDAERDKVARLRELGCKKYILITNVQGSAHLEVGSIDRVEASLSEQLGLPCQVWWRNDINRRLDDKWNIKLAYPEVMIGQDFLRLVIESFGGEEKERRRQALSALLTDQYNQDREVKFKQVDLKNKLFDLFVDLPFRLLLPASSLQGFPDSCARAGYRIVEHDNDGVVLTSSEIATQQEETSTASLLLAGFPSQVVVEGGPGQGKSTLAQYLCQVHRIRWLQKKSDITQISADHRTAKLRIPIKVDLRDLAQWLTGIDPFATQLTAIESEQAESVECFLARLVRHHSGGASFSVADLLLVTSSLPMLLVFDGLDEVADIEQRELVVKEVSRTVNRLKQNSADLQIVVTSRPAAFANSPGFDSADYPRLDLLALNPSQIFSYANKWANLKGLKNKERTDFDSLLRTKLSESHVRDLTRNPMQLTIFLSLLETHGAALPDRRTTLYTAYIDYFFAREALKSPSVRVHRDLLKEIHAYLGWAIHSASESERASGRIPREIIIELIEAYLTSEGYKNVSLEDIFAASVERVFMLVSRVEGTYEFEVQPLREYFAAKHLYETSSYSPTGRERKGTKPDRFDAIARNFYWSNVTRFYAGFFSKGELLDLADRLKELSSDHTMGLTRYPVRLAAMLLSDWVFSQSPRAVEQIVGSLCDIEQLSKLIPSDDEEEDEGVYVPSNFGGSEVGEAALIVVQQTRQLDWFERVVGFAAVHVSEDRLREFWAKWPSDTKLDDWILLSTYIQGDCSAELEQKIVNMHHLTESFVDTAVGCGLAYAVANRPQVDSALQASLLDRRQIRFWSYGDPVDAFNLLQIVLSISRGDWMVRNAYHRLRSLFEREKNLTLEVSDPSPFTAEVVELATEMAGRYRAMPDSMGFLEGTLERARQLWGDRPAILAAFFSLSDYLLAPNIAACDILDNSKPLMPRLLYARIQTDNSPEWWITQMTAADRSEQFFIALLLFTHSTVDNLVALAPAISRMLEKMDDGLWGAVRDFGAPFIRTDRKERNLEADDITALLAGERIATLAAWRYPQELGVTAFYKYFQNDTTAATADLRQEASINAACAGMMEWSDAVSRVRQSYLVGATNLGSYSEFNKVPSEVCAEILKRPFEYPAGLVDLVVTLGLDRAKDSVIRVGDIAEKDVWFDVKP